MSYEVVPDPQNVEIASSAPLPARDFFTQQEILGQQTAGPTRRLTFTFTTPVQLAYIFLVDQQSHTGHFTANGATPTPSFGIPILPGVPLSIPCQTSVIEVDCDEGGAVSVWGYRY